jgi:hypothetical protein
MSEMDETDPYLMRADQERLAAESDREDMEWWAKSLSTPVGRRCIWQRLDAAGTFRRGNEHYAVSGDGHPYDRVTDYHLGSYDYGRQWFEWLEYHFTSLVVLMRKENDPRYAPVSASVSTEIDS